MAKSIKNEIENSTKEAAKIIADATELAAKAIASAAEIAAKVVANTAAESARTIAIRGADDHDLLIELKTRMEGLKSDIKEIKDGTALKIDNHDQKIDAIEKWQSSLEGENGMLADIPKNCKRLTALESGRANQSLLMSIGIALLSILVGIIVWHVFKI